MPKTALSKPQNILGSSDLTTTQSVLSALTPFSQEKERKLVRDHRANERRCRNLSPGIPGSRAMLFTTP